MQKLLFIMLLLLPSIRAAGSEIRAVLMDALYIKNDSIALTDLVENIPKNDFVIHISTNRFFSNSEIQGMLNKIGIKESVLIGAGTYVIRIGSLNPYDNISKYIKDNYKPYNLNPDPAWSVLNEEYKIIGISNEIFSNEIMFHLDCVKFSGNKGKLTNLILSAYFNRAPACPSDNEVQNGSDDSCRLLDIDGNDGTLVYRKGSIEIIMKVKIIRTLEDNTFIVENNRSGKIFKVKLRD